MKTTFLILTVLTILIIPMAVSAAELADIAGTWSGSWQPKGGVIDALTVEVRLDATGKVSGKFRTPVPMDFSKASFDPKTGVVMIEATDAKSGKAYKIDGKLNGTEIKGTLTVGESSGELLLIKWTYVPR